MKYNERDHHIRKVYKDMKELTRICPKLEVSCCLLLGKPHATTARGPMGQRTSYGLHLPHVRPQVLLSDPKEMHSLTGAGA